MSVEKTSSRLKCHNNTKENYCNVMKSNQMVGQKNVEMDMDYVRM